MWGLPERFGKYHVLDRLAQGGMAEVYKVKTIGLAGFEKIQALKRILPAFAGQQRFIRNFIDEARIAVELNHRNIVQVFDFGKAEGELYLAMELIEGVDLRTASYEAASDVNGMPWPIACHIMSEAAGAIEYAHAKTDQQGTPLGIVHCDLSPHNIMLSYDGYVKVLDFGVARAAFAAEQGTGTRRLRGKPRYMAPEQTRGDNPTYAADVFALGIVAWELLTGLPLFDGDDLQSVLLAVRRCNVPAITQLNPEVPAAIADSVMRALQLAPAERGTAGDLARVMTRGSRDGDAGPRELAEWLRAVFSLAAPPSLEPPRAPSGDQEVTSVAGPRAIRSTDQAPGQAPGQASGQAPRAAGLPRIAADGPVDRTAATRDISVSDLATAVAPAEVLRAPEPTATVRRTRVGFDASAPGGDEAPTALMPPPPRRPTTLLEDSAPPIQSKRRAVAVAILLDGASPARHKELVGVLADLAYKRSAVIEERKPDSLVVVFGLEIAGEDDVAAALTFAESVDAVVGETGGAGACARIGTASGLVAPRADVGYHMLGDIVEDARALARGAAPGRPQLAGGADRLTSSLYLFRELPTRTNRRRRLRVLEMVGRRGFADRDRPLFERRGRFFGRQDELAALERAFQDAIESRSRIVARVSGAPGVGKTRLIAECLARLGATDPEALIVGASAAPAAALAPFSVIADLVLASLDLPPGRGEAARRRMGERVRALLTRTGFAEDAIAETVSALEQAFELRDGALLSSVRASDDLRERVAAAVAVLRQAQSAARGDRSLVTVIDDLHWIDAASAEVLRLLRTFVGAPELVILAARSDQFELPAADVAVYLSDLEGQPLEELISDRLGEADEPAHQRAISERAGGNPLFIEELAGTVREQGLSAIPGSLRDVVLARVDRLGPSARLAVQLAAVIGMSVRARLLEELAGPDLSAELNELCDAGLFVRSGQTGQDPSEGELRFARGLARDAIYESLPARIRKESHGRVGRLLAARHQAGRDEPPALIARHLDLGGEGHRAPVYYLLAGQVALAACDARAAVEAFNRTLELETQSTPEAVERRREALRGREDAHALLGETASRVSDLTELEDLAADDPLALVDVARRSARLASHQGDYRTALDHADAISRHAAALREPRLGLDSLLIRADALERLGELEAASAAQQQILSSPVSPTERALMRLGLARVMRMQGRHHDALRACHEVIEEAEREDDAMLARLGHQHAAAVELSLGHYDSAFAHAQRTLALCRSVGDRTHEGDGVATSAAILSAVGQYETARSLFEDAINLLQGAGSRWSLADGLIAAAENATRQGASDVAVGLAERALHAGRAQQADYLVARALIVLADALLAHPVEANWRRAAGVAADALEIARRRGLRPLEAEALARRADALLRTGDTTDAIHLSSAAVEVLDSIDAIDGSEELLLDVLARALKNGGDPASAGAVWDRARDQLLRKHHQLRDPQWRESYSDSVSLHRDLLE